LDFFDDIQLNKREVIWGKKCFYGKKKKVRIIKKLLDSDEEQYFINKRVLEEERR